MLERVVSWRVHVTKTIRVVACPDLPRQAFSKNGLAYNISCDLCYPPENLPYKLTEGKSVFVG